MCFLNVQFMYQLTGAKIKTIDAVFTGKYAVTEWAGHCSKGPFLLNFSLILTQKAIFHVKILDINHFDITSDDF